MVTKAGADVLHGCDGYFVLIITIGPCVVQSIRKVTNCRRPPDDLRSAKYLEPFVQATAIDHLSYRSGAGTHGTDPQAKGWG